MPVSWSKFVFLVIFLDDEKTDSDDTQESPMENGD